MTQTVTKFKWFWGWNDDKEEAWLEEMAQQGFHLVSANFIANYTFEIGAPKDVVYRLDFYFGDQSKHQEYLQIFDDAGWNKVCEFGGWQYFRTEQIGQKIPEIYTDKNSKIVKYQRLMLFLSITLPLIFFPTLLFTLTENLIITEPFNLLYRGLQIISGFYALVYLIAMAMFFRRIKQIRNEPIVE